MKKIITTILVLALLLIQLPLAVNAASGTNNDNGIITINNAIAGKTYSVYQLLTLESYDTDAKAYRYTVNSTWETFIKSVEGTYVEIDEFGYVTWKEGADVVAFSKAALAHAKTNSIAATATQKASSATVTFEKLNLGYYLLDSSTGVLCGLNTTKPSVEISEKNTEVVVEKEVKEASTNTFGEKNDAKIGDIIEFKTTITVGAGAENYKLYDKLSEGLTLLDTEENKISVKVNGEEVDASNYTKTTDFEKGTFTIEFKNDYIFTLSEKTEIIVSYYAELNEKAVIEGEGNLNETYVTYGDDNETTHDYTRTYTYSFTLNKVNSEGKTIEGAEFRLYADAKAENEIKLVYDAEAGVYRVSPNANSGETIKVGTATIEGLDHTKYYLKETKQPEGYNILTSLVEVNVNGTDLSNKEVIDITENYQNTEVEVENKTGAELPSTGSVGTMMFIAVGTMMILGFGVLLVTKLRMSKMTI